MFSGGKIEFHEIPPPPVAKILTAWIFFPGHTQTKKSPKVTWLSTNFNFYRNYQELRGGGGGGQNGVRH